MEIILPNSVRARIIGKERLIRQAEKEGSRQGILVSTCVILAVFLAAIFGVTIRGLGC